MTIHAGKLALASISLLIAAVVFFGGCSYFSSKSVPLTYARVASLPRLGDLSEPFGIAVKDDVIYVSDGGTGTIRRIDAVGNATTLATGLNTPSAIAFLPGGELVVADTGSHTIRKIAVDGAMTIFAGLDGVSGENDGPAAVATFNGPVGVAVATDGAVYVADTYNDRIRLIRDGVVSTIAGSERGFADGPGALAKFDTPLGITVWDDKLLVADSGNARVRTVDRDGLVTTLAGSGHAGLMDGTLSSAGFVMPTSVATDDLGRIFIADDDAIRVIGRRTFPFVETLAGDQRGFADGESRRARFSRPSGLAVGQDGALYVADSDNRAVRVISDQPGNKKPLSVKDDPLPLAERWPFDPPQNPREVAGTLGEIRGEIGPENKPTWFHNGLDIAGAYGETARFLRSEAVLDPHAAENFATSRELLRMPLLGYIHLRLGRDKDNNVFPDPRFQFERDASGRLARIRVPRGSRFSAGDAIGTLNAMNHVHLIAGRSGREINALSALKLPGVSDAIPPVIEEVKLYGSSWDRLATGPGEQITRLPEGVRIVVKAYDRMDGNSERRRLGVYRVGYQLLSNGSPLTEIDWRIRFDRTPSNDAVSFAYADGSRSGYTPDTVFNYIATNRVDGEVAREDFLDTTNLAPGKYILRVFAADYFGNIASKDVEVMK